MGLREQKKALLRLFGTFAEVAWINEYPPVIETVVSSRKIAEMRQAIYLGLSDALEECDEEGIDVPLTSVTCDAELKAVRHWYNEVAAPMYLD